jgi:hypothetical protein
MLVDWNALSEELQLMVSREAMRRAAEVIADQADELASEMETGGLSDRGGPEALRLLAAVVRSTGNEAQGAVGHA